VRLFKYLRRVLYNETNIARKRAGTEVRLSGIGETRPEGYLHDVSEFRDGQTGSIQNRRMHGRDLSDHITACFKFLNMNLNN